MPANVVFINRFFYPDLSATSQMLADLCFALAEDGYRVSVITSNNCYDGDASPTLAREENIRGVQVRRCRTTHFGRGHLLGRIVDYVSFYMSALWCVLVSVRRGDVVVVKTDPPLLSVMLWPALRLRRARQVNWIQDLFPEIADQLNMPLLDGVVGRLLSWLRDRVCRISYYNVVISQHMGQYLARRGIANSRLMVIPNWAPLGVEPVDHRTNPLRKAWNLGGRFVIGYSGNLGRAHDWHSLLCLVKAFRNDPSVCFLFIGGGAGMELLEREIADGEFAHVQFRPYQPREYLSDSLSVIDLHLVTLDASLGSFLVPSKIYGIAAVGRPAIFIGPSESEVADLLRNHDFGCAVDNGDDISLIEAVQELINNKATYQSSCQHAKEAHDRYFSFAAVLAKWRDLLRHCGARSQPLSAAK